jgi:hypothetical protein
MVQPLAYAHVGFVDSLGRFYTLVESDTPGSNRLYVIPQEYRSSRGADGQPDIAVSLCSDTKVPTALITGFLEPYIDPAAVAEIKQKFGNTIDLAPLPMFSAGSMLMVSGLAETWAITVDDRPDSYDEVPDGLPEAWAQRLKVAAYKWKNFGIRPAIHQLWEDPNNGAGIVYPARTGSNVGAKVPISFLSRGEDNFRTVADQISKGSVVTGQIAYCYKGTIRPYYLNVRCDISKIHDYFSANFSAGNWFAAADIYQSVEILKHQDLIKIEIYDENHKITEKYNVQQILDKILESIIKAVFDTDPKVQAEKKSAEARNGGRWWWWSGGFSFKGSHAEYSRIFNFEMKISGLSSPIPVTIGVRVDAPKASKIGCDALIAQSIEASYLAEKDASDRMPPVLSTMGVSEGVQEYINSFTDKG